MSTVPISIKPAGSVRMERAVRKFHTSLNVSNLARSIAFYRELFGVEPAKAYDDYAKFELADPPLVLSLVPKAPIAGGHLNHAGVRVLSPEELVAAQRRLEQAGFPTRREDGVECCYALQTKFWVSDPDGLLWEIYVFHEDVDHHGHGSETHETPGTMSGTSRALRTTNP
jgi:catechol 2,3-dioxygenase-like lactoylglutathione lyase family enzyme